MPSPYSMYEQVADRARELHPVHPFHLGDAGAGEAHGQVAAAAHRLGDRDIVPVVQERGGQGHAPFTVHDAGIDQTDAQAPPGGGTGSLEQALGEVYDERDAFRSRAGTQVRGLLDRSEPPVRQVQDDPPQSDHGVFDAQRIPIIAVQRQPAPASGFRRVGEPTLHEDFIPRQGGYRARDRGMREFRLLDESGSRDRREITDSTQDGGNRSSWCKAEAHTSMIPIFCLLSIIRLLTIPFERT